MSYQESIGRHEHTIAVRVHQGIFGVDIESVDRNKYKCQ